MRRPPPPRPEVGLGQVRGSEEFDAEIVDEGKDVKRKELEEEKARLLARIAEIDKLLAE